MVGAGKVVKLSGVRISRGTIYISKCVLTTSREKARQDYVSSRPPAVMLKSQLIQQGKIGSLGAAA